MLEKDEKSAKFAAGVTGSSASAQPFGATPRSVLASHSNFSALGTSEMVQLGPSGTAQPLTVIQWLSTGGVSPSLPPGSLLQLRLSAGEDAPPGRGKLLQPLPEVRRVPHRRHRHRARSGGTAAGSRLFSSPRPNHQMSKH